MAGTEAEAVFRKSYALKGCNNALASLWQIDADL